MAPKEMSSSEVIKVAALVKLTVSPEEVSTYQKTIPQTLDTIEILDELDTKTTLPTSQVTGLENVFRNYSAKSTLTQDLALANAEEKDKGLFITKAVFTRL